MRVIAGGARGRRLRPVRGRQVRPTADRVREALFSILHARLSDGEWTGLRVLDLFAGTGALGIEALSRGADFATFVESDRDAAATVRENLDLCGFTGQGRVEIETVEHFLAVAAGGAGGATLSGANVYGLVFVDPPYDSGLHEKILTSLRPAVLDREAIVVIEHGNCTELPVLVGGVARFDQRTYGDTALSFYCLDVDRVRR